MKLKRLALAAWLLAAGAVPLAWASIYTDTLTVTGTSSLGGVASVVTPTSGGIPYFSTTTTQASSALLAANALIIGGGAGTAPSTITAGSTGQILAGVTSAAPVFTATPTGLTSLSATTLNSTTTNLGNGAGTAGTLQIFPGTTTTGSTTLTASANSGNTTTNINTAGQAAARTYTVPDQGGNANFLLTGATVSPTTGMISSPIPMTAMRTAAGLMMTASASGTNFGLTYTPGTTAILIGTATSSGSTSDVVAFDYVLPPNYIAGTNLSISMGCYYTNGSSTASVHTVTPAAYLNGANGLQGSTLVTTGAQICPITTSAILLGNINGATLVPGSYLTITVTLNMTNAGGASTGNVTSVSID